MPLQHRGKTNLTNSLPHYAKTKDLYILKRLLKSNEKPRNITAARSKNHEILSFIEKVQINKKNLGTSLRRGVC